MLLVEPFTPGDDLIVHHGDVRRRPAKGGQAKFKEKGHNFADPSLRRFGYGRFWVKILLQARLVVHPANSNPLGIKV
jgi:hypothetical protein